MLTQWWALSSWQLPSRQPRVTEATHQPKQWALSSMCGHFVCLVQVNCLMLLFTAHDTVASTLALLLRFLKQTPEALQKLRAEQRQVTSPFSPPSSA